MDTDGIQKILLATARLNAESPGCWALELSELLHRSRYSIYKKLGGASRLSLDEAVTVARTYGVSLDSLAAAADSAIFKPLTCPEDGHPASFLAGILHIYESIARQRMSLLVTFYPELPVEFLSRFPEIAREYAQKASGTNFNKSPFNEQRRIAARIKSLENITAAREMIDIIEFWPENTAENLLKCISIHRSESDPAPFVSSEHEVVFEALDDYIKIDGSVMRRVYMHPVRHLPLAYATVPAERNVVVLYFYSDLLGWWTGIFTSGYHRFISALDQLRRLSARIPGDGNDSFFTRRFHDLIQSEALP